jgi:hypothetical protein
LIVLIYCLRSLYLRANFEELQKHAIEAKTRAITVGKVVDEAGVPAGANEVDPHTGKKLNDQEFENLEEQYNPHHDFAIFGVGNKKGGGLQTLQEKMNCADDVEEAKNSSDDETEKDQREEQYTTKDKLNPQDIYKQVASDSMVVSSRLPASGRVDGRPSSSGVSSDEPLNKEAQPQQYDLPEDKEIQEATEEEEEEV